MESLKANNDVFTELGRKSLHILMGGFAFLLRYLSWEAALLCALAALLNNLFLLPRLTAKFYREGQPKDIGIIFYPISVFFIILFFPNRMYLAAGIWAIMALGDGFATIFGKRFGKTKLPWHTHKSWIGSIAYLIAASAGASLLIWWTLHPLPEGENPLFFYLLLPLLLAFFSALMESLPFGVNDNILVPMTGAFAAYLIIKVHEANVTLPWDKLPELLLYGIGASIVLGLFAMLLKLVSKKGFIAGIFAGTLIYTFTNWMGFLLLALFFIIASALTKFGYKKKEARGLAQEDKGARGTRHVAANVTLAMILGVVWFVSGFNPVFAVAFAASLATALSDTSASEFGQLYGKHTFMITNFKRVQPGTDGAISAEGTLAGFVAPFILAVAAYLSGFVSLALAAFIIGIAGFFGNIIESYLNAYIKDKSESDNELMNFLNTITGAGIAILVFNLLL